MKVHVVLEQDAYDDHRPAEPVAVVMDAAGIKFPCYAVECRLTGSPAQESAAEAFRAVSGLSAGARDELGLSAGDIAVLKANAEGGTGAGAALTVVTYRDGAKTEIEGVFLERPSDLKGTFLTFSQFTLARNIGEHLQAERAREAQAGLKALSPQTLNALPKR